MGGGRERLSKREKKEQRETDACEEAVYRGKDETQDGRDRHLERVKKRGRLKTGNKSE